MFSFSIKLGRAPQSERSRLEVDGSGKVRPFSTRPSPSPASTAES
jgi:hypothetical protein